MLKDDVDQEEFVRPATPEIKEEKRKDKDKGSSSDDHKQPRLPGKKRHRRAKGKRKKQKTCLMITNDDGTHSTTSQEPAHQQRKVCLRPSNNPLLKAPKNSTQYIIDDHENSNLFVDFGDERSNEAAEPDPEQYIDSDRLSPDDDNFFTQYAERDFESVYATAHQEEVSSWEREKIIEEISAMERRQKQLVEVLSTIDPTVYLQKLQHELLSLQEVNRQLKLRNIAERLERQQIRDRRGIASRHSSPRLPDSTSNVGEESDSSSGSSSSGSSSSSSSGTSSGTSSSSESDGDSDGGGCSSGCCLADNDTEDEEEGKKEEEKKSEAIEAVDVKEAIEAVDDKEAIEKDGDDKEGGGTGDGIDQG